MRFCAQNPKYRTYYDQDVLNYCFSTRILKLPLKFNQSVFWIRQFKETVQKGNIYHYAGTIIGMGLGFDMNDLFNRLWMNYFVKTPFFNAETIINLYETFQHAYKEIQDRDNISKIKVSAAMSGKRRAFIILKDELNSLVKNFSVRKDEEIIIVEPTTPPQKLIELIKARDEQIFFILLPKFPFEIMTAAGLVEGEDFINGFDFFSEATLLSYMFLRQM